jgi:hypothetical protein
VRAGDCDAEDLGPSDAADVFECGTIDVAAGDPAVKCDERETNRGQL